MFSGKWTCGGADLGGVPKAHGLVEKASLTSGLSGVLVFVFMCVSVCHVTCVEVIGQLNRTRVSSSTVWVLGIELRWSGLVVSTFTC